MSNNSNKKNFLYWLLGIALLILGIGIVIGLSFPDCGYFFAIVFILIGLYILNST